MAFFNGSYKLALARFHSGIGLNIEEITTESFSAYPNPVSLSYTSSFTFTHSPLHNPADIIINSTDGREVMRYHVQQGSSSEKVKLPGLAKGVYVARMVGEGVSANTKFVVN